MPIARVQMPDGRIARLEVPEGTQPQDVESFALEHAANLASADPTGSFGQNVAAGMGRVLNRVGQGVRQMGAQAMDAIVPTGTLRPTRTQAVQAEIDESAELDKPLMQSAGGKVGDLLGNVAMTVPALAVPGANTYAGAATLGSLMGLVQPTQGDESRLLNTTVGAGAGLAGQFVGNKVAGAISNAVTKDAAQVAAKQAQNAPRDAALAAGREAGLVAPPRMVQKQGVLGTVLEGAGGKVKTEQLASNKNQPVVNELARKALGIADDTPITTEVLNGIRKQAGQAYEALRGAGTITADKQFGADLAKITAKFQGAAKDFPELAKNEIGDIVASVNKPQFSADAALDAISILRDKAAAAYGKGDKGLGSAYKQTSQAMEDAIERNLLQNGNADAVKAFQAARKLIAKTYSVEKALGAGGDVSATALASQLKKGKPLSDELKVIAEFAHNFPKAMQNTAKVEPVSVLDIFAGGALGASAGMPAAALPLARPAIRSLVLSKPYQAMTATPSYAPSSGLRIADLLAQHPALRQGLTGGAVGLGLANAQ